MGEQDQDSKDFLQEIADHYGVFVYETEDKVVTVGFAQHGFDCERPRQL